MALFFFLLSVIHRKVWLHNIVINRRKLPSDIINCAISQLLAFQKNFHFIGKTMNRREKCIHPSLRFHGGIESYLLCILRVSQLRDLLTRFRSPRDSRFLPTRLREREKKKNNEKHALRKTKQKKKIKSSRGIFSIRGREIPQDTKNHKKNLTTSKSSRFAIRITSLRVHTFKHTSRIRTHTQTHVSRVWGVMKKRPRASEVKRVLSPWRAAWMTLASIHRLTIGEMTLCCHGVYASLPCALSRRDHNTRLPY